MKTYLGDGVMASPLIGALTANGATVTCLTSSSVSDLLDLGKQHAALVPFRRDKTLKATIRQAQELRRQGFEAAILINHSFRSALVARLAGIPKRIGHAREGRRLLLTDPLPYDTSRFEAFAIGGLAAPLGIEAAELRPRLEVSEQEKERGRWLLQGATVGFQPGARHAYKQLPLEVTVAVARQLQELGHSLVMLGGAEEGPSGEAVEQALPRPIVNLIGKTSVRETLGCLANLSVAFGSDTGVMHMSAAIGCPTVQVFGSPKALKWGHDYSPHRVLRAPEDNLERLSGEQLLQAVLVAIENLPAPKQLA